jgi:hypothetical protein
MESHLSLEPLEQLIADIITIHPEYHSQIKKIEDALKQDYLPESGQSNPFLHMGMHISLREQLQADQPTGINSTYDSLIKKGFEIHDLEHMMMDCLAEALWQAQQNNQPPDEQAYLQCLKALV